MTVTQQLGGEVAVHRMEYDDGTVVLTADLGPASDAAVDVVDDTAIVVVEGNQYDVDLPAGEPRAFIRNGVLTIELSRELEGRQE